MWANCHQTAIRSTGLVTAFRFGLVRVVHFSRTKVHFQPSDEGWPQFKQCNASSFRSAFLMIGCFVSNPNTSLSYVSGHGKMCAVLNPPAQLCFS